jgi:hypothetical protein
MYSGITKIYYRKTVGHVFSKTVQIEGTTQKFFSRLQTRPFVRDINNLLKLGVCASRNQVVAH